VTGLRMVLLGAPRAVHLNRWKDDIAEAGEALGWQVTHLEANGAPVDDVVRLCKGADLFMWARTHRHDPAGDAAAMLCRIEDLGVATVGIHMDLYWGIPNRELRVGAQPWWGCQHVFTADGANQARFAERGIRHHWMPPAMGLRFHGRARPAGKYRHRAVFVGTNIRYIHGPHRDQLLRWARRRWRGDFRHYGAGAQKVFGRELSRLYASTHVVLGDSAPAARYWSDRLPMTLGRGGLLAYPRTEGLAEQGFDESLMLLYDRFAFDDLGDRIDALSDRERAAMTDAALTVVGERHLWTHRLETIRQVVLP
jgi:hypothetical protein